MEISYLLFLLIIVVEFAYGQSSIRDECVPVNILLKMEKIYNCCLEEKITCINNHVTEIDLWYANLNITIPPEIGTLSKLTVLNLGATDIYGTIPPEIGNLVNLEILSLSNNKLEGSIPPEIGKLTKLKNLSLNDNNLSGTIPSTIGKLSNLQGLYLEYNNLTSPIPKEIENLTELKNIDLSVNNFSEDEIEKLSKLLEKNSSFRLTKTDKIVIGVLVFILGISLVIFCFINHYLKKEKGRNENRNNVNSAPPNHNGINNNISSPPSVSNPPNNLNQRNNDLPSYNEVIDEIIEQRIIYLNNHPQMDLNNHPQMDITQHHP